jgi:formamidopyrimidine-DNA glycosylase
LPELPDVETFKRYLDATSLHQRIEKIRVYDRQILKGISTRQLKEVLEGYSFQSTLRHGKYLFVKTENDTWLVLHFGMTGFLKYFKDPDKEPPHSRVVVDFFNGYHLSYDSQRKLGMVTLTKDVGKFIKVNRLGPDALEPDFDFARFKCIIGEKRRTVKSALMNQSLVAGIGNVYSDEILFQAQIHPKTTIRQLDEKKLKKMFRTMKRVLKVATDAKADPENFPDSYLTPYRNADAKCPKCGKCIQRTKVFGRTAYWCPGCQPASEK